jgi:hypothetical protein
MTRRGRLWGITFVVLAVTLGLVLSNRDKAKPQPEVPFTDLDTALASATSNGWTVSVPPKRPGPYRLVPGGPVLGSSDGAGLECRIKDQTGTVVEEIRLVGTADLDQSVVYLETADGQTTMAALKRSR